ncbi:MAG TPA: CHASE3 domain-containing protein [Vicinamibacterales bacterium]|nr:CHASE3 domain-containing protein [Vicinamibacterales bacterium]
MYRGSLDRSLTVWLIFTLIVLTLSTWLSYRSLADILRNDERVIVSQALLAELNATLSTLKDAETGQRGFLITGEESYLTPYNRAVSESAQHVQRLKVLTADDPDQRRSLPLLERFINTKLGELRETIDLRRGVSFSAAQAIVLTNEGKNTMEEIRRLVALMEGHETDVLQRRSAESEASSRRARLTIFGDGLMGGLLLLLFFAHVRKNMRERTVLLHKEEAARHAAERAFEGERQARDRAEQASRLKDEFLATVSHELRTPLNAILGWARMLHAGTVDPKSINRGLESIERNAVAQAQLIEDLLDVSRIVAGRLRLEVVPLDLVDVIRAAVDVVKPAADAKRIQIDTSFDRTVAAVTGDPQRLQQVVWNLLSNSIKFTPGGGRVEARLERRDGKAAIVVRDTGNGIAPEFLPHVFELFRQADGGPSRKHGGLGLGLAIVRRIVEMHGGTIRAESPGDGQGATFIVELPLLGVRAAEGTEWPAHGVGKMATALALSLETAPRLDGLRILAVDDQKDTLEVIEAVLVRCGAEVRTCGDANAAVEEVRAWRPDLLVADIGLPDEDGYALIQRVRNLPADEGGQTPAVALTAYARVEDRMRTLSAGYHMHVAKPVEPLDLVTILGTLAGRT